MKAVVAMIVLALVSLAGCAGGLVRNVVAPEVYLAGIRPLESGVLEQRMMVDLSVVNPNRFGITISRMNFALDVNDSRLASGLTEDGVTVPGRGERTVSVTARTGVIQIARQLMKLPGTHTLKYHLTGELELGRFAGKRFPLDFQGELNRDALFGGGAN